MRRYDLALFLKLNDEWKDRPLVPRSRTVDDPAQLAAQARKRAETVLKHVRLDGARVLEIGCGRGQFVRVIADEYGSLATGLDVKRYPEWGEDPRFIEADIADPPDLGEFDVIVSHAVWEHLQHPYASLDNQRDLLAPDGIVYFYANLYRGAKASHRYRDVHFPWPHLLFTDDVFEAFHERLGVGPRRAAWVNKLTYAQYVDHFERIGYGIERVWPSAPWFDEPFYRDHWEILGRYPKWDLQHDFIHAVLTREPGVGQKRDTSHARTADAAAAALRTRIRRMEASTSWRITAPFRAAHRVLRRAIRGTRGPRKRR